MILERLYFGRQTILTTTALTAALLIGAQPSLPTQQILQKVETWNFLSESERLVLKDARKALANGRWVDALDRNEQLIDAAPKDIFFSPPTLPLIDIRPSGAKAAPTPSLVVDGWKWKLETAWLAAYGRDFDGAARRFELIRYGSMTYAGAAAEGAAFAKMRLQKYADASQILAANGTLTVDLRQVLVRASRGSDADWGSLHTTALGVATPQAAEIPSPTLSGPIGRKGGRTLPGVGVRSASPNTSFQAGRFSKTASVEAALILAEAWGKRGPGEPRTGNQPNSWVTGDKQRRARSEFYINVVLRQGDAFPHHKILARSLAQVLARVKSS